MKQFIFILCVVFVACFGFVICAGVNSKANAQDFSEDTYLQDIYGELYADCILVKALSKDDPLRLDLKPLEEIKVPLLNTENVQQKAFFFLKEECDETKILETNKILNDLFGSKEKVFILPFKENETSKVIYVTECRVEQDLPKEEMDFMGTPTQCVVGKFPLKIQKGDAGENLAISVTFAENVELTISSVDPFEVSNPFEDVGVQNVALPCFYLNFEVDRASSSSFCGHPLNFSKNEGTPSYLSQEKIISEVCLNEKGFYLQAVNEFVTSESNELENHNSLPSITVTSLSTPFFVTLTVDGAVVAIAHIDGMEFISK